MIGLLKVGSPALAFVGLMVTGIVGLQLAQGQVSVGAAATRVLVVALSLAAVDRLVLPLARTLVTSGHRTPD